jgi:hypothetical protein
VLLPILLFPLKSARAQHHRRTKPLRELQGARFGRLSPVQLPSSAGIPRISSACPLNQRKNQGPQTWSFNIDPLPPRPPLPGVIVAFPFSPFQQRLIRAFACNRQARIENPLFSGVDNLRNGLSPFSFLPCLHWYRYFDDLIKFRRRPENFIQSDS